MYRSTFVAATMALFVIGGTAAAQATATRAPTAQHRFRRGELLEGINLTAQQKSQIEAIRAKYHPELKSARDSIKPDWSALKTARTAKDSAAIRAARQDIRTDRRERGTIEKAEHDEIVGVLRPEQRERFEKNVKEWNADRRERRADRREIGSDTRETRNDRREVAADKSEIAADKKEGDNKDLKADRKDLESDEKDLHNDLKDRKKDARELKHDRKSK